MQVFTVADEKSDAASCRANANWAGFRKARQILTHLLQRVVYKSADRIKKMIRTNGPAYDAPINEIKIDTPVVFRDYFYSPSVPFRVFTRFSDPAHDLSDLWSHLQCLFDDGGLLRPTFCYPTGLARSEAWTAR
jgi:hypothetical protein